jgi:hypothetical protein
VIIYTDGALKEAGNEGTGTAPSISVQSLTEKYPASFSGAEIHVYGIAANNQNTPATEQLFSGFFLKSWARLKSFSPSLPQQDHFLFPPVLRVNGVFEGGKAQGSVKLALFNPNQVDVADGWLAFSVGREALYVPFQGEYRCNGDDCRLAATCSETVPLQSSNPYFRKGDKIRLSGKKGRSLEGSLEADGREVFKDGNQTVKYSLRFTWE